MGASDRDYFRDEERRYAAMGGQPLMPPVTKALLIANIVLFLIDFFSRPGPIDPGAGVINTPLAFSIRSAFLEGRIWEVLTFQFLHFSPLHILGNCIGLYFFAPWAERWWGSRRFIVFYLLCGVAGALFFTLLTLVGILPGRDLEAPLVGASAGIFGILLCIAVIDPNAMVRLLIPPIELTMRKMALIFMGIAVFVILIDNVLGGSASLNSGGEAGHLGGAILGYLLTKYPSLLRKGVGKEEKIIRPKEFRKKRQEGKLKPRTSVDVVKSTEVDRILDKINREGIQSLTDEERETLKQASKPTEER